MATNTARQPPQLHPDDPLLRMETEPPPAFLLRTVQIAEQPAAKTPARWSGPGLMVWFALGAAAVLVVAAAAGGYWLIKPAQKQVATLPAPETTAPSPSLVSPANHPPPNETSQPPAASPPAAAADQPPSAVAALPATPEPVPPAAPAVETPPVPATEKPADPLHNNDVFVVRFDSKLPGLTPTGLRALNAALRAVHAGRKVQIAIDGCDGADSAPNGVSCAELTRRLKWILTDRGIHRPAALIADTSRP